MLTSWYDKYESQCWYKNTFLVKNPSQISQATSGDREWNNIEGSGCNFVCLSMIIGINPAHIASYLKDTNGYFGIDKSLASKNLKGESTHLVWDRNKPSFKGDEITIKEIHHPEKGITNVTVKLEIIEMESDIVKARELITKHKSDGKHIICGYDDHSRLVAGTKSGEYYLWDPDLESTKLDDNINGEHSLDWFYSMYASEKKYANKSAEYWVYSVTFS